MDLGRVSDTALRRIGGKLAASERLTTHDALDLYRTGDLSGLGYLADTVNRA